MTILLLATVLLNTSAQDHSTSAAEYEAAVPAEETLPEAA